MVATSLGGSLLAVPMLSGRQAELTAKVAMEPPLAAKPALRAVLSLRWRASAGTPGVALGQTAAVDSAALRNARHGLNPA